MTQEGKLLKLAPILVLNVIFPGMSYYRTCGYQIQLLEMLQVVNSEARTQMWGENKLN
jgi:hypothetical protein